METATSVKSSSSPPPPLQRSFFIAQIMIRILAIAFTSAAISLMITSNQTLMLFGIKSVASYTNSSAMKFLLGANITACIFSIVSLVFVCVVSRPESHKKKFSPFYLFLHDTVIMVLLISGCAAATAIGYVSKYGEEKVGWFAICGTATKFCNRVMISLGLSYLAFFSYLSLTITSANKSIQPLNE